MPIAAIPATPIRSMQAALEARLRLAFPEGVFALERVSAPMPVQEFERVLQRAPVLGLAWRGIKPDPKSGRRLLGLAQWTLTLVVRNAASVEGRFRGDALGPGLDEMLDVALALLHGWSVPDVGAVTLTTASAVYAEGVRDQGAAMAQIDFDVMFEAYAGPLVAADDLERLAVSWSLRPPLGPAQGSRGEPTDTLELGETP